MLLLTLPMRVLACLLSAMHHEMSQMIAQKEVQMNFKEDYPYNLLSHVFPCVNTTTDFSWPDDIEGTVAYVLYELPERERKCLVLYFKDNMTHAEIGKMLTDITAERVRQLIIRAERQLRTPRLSRMLELGIKGLIKNAEQRQREKRLDEFLVEVEKSMLKVLEQNNAKVQLDKSELYNKPISELNLSFRPNKCLIEKGCKTIGDVMNLTYDEFTNIDNLGAVSRKQITDALDRFGVECAHLKWKL